MAEGSSKHLDAKETSPWSMDRIIEGRETRLKILSLFFTEGGNPIDFDFILQTSHESDFTYLETRCPWQISDEQIHEALTWLNFDIFNYLTPRNAISVLSLVFKIRSALKGEKRDLVEAHIEALIHRLLRQKSSPSQVDRNILDQILPILETNFFYIRNKSLRGAISRMYEEGRKMNER